MAFIRIINMSLESAAAGAIDALKRLAVSLRNEKFSYVEKKAYEVPVKILIPLVCWYLRLFL
ncbi:MAG: hypothetical protein LE168_01195 [Endomicrobium sp.]|nr:hypothetical protein [Endomicrobium sp.]